MPSANPGRCLPTLLLKVPTGADCTRHVTSQRLVREDAPKVFPAPTWALMNTLFYAFYISFQPFLLQIKHKLNTKPVFQTGCVFWSLDTSPPTSFTGLLPLSSNLPLNMLQSKHNIQAEISISLLSVCNYF